MNISTIGAIIILCFFGVLLGYPWDIPGGVAILLPGISRVVVSRNRVPGVIFFGGLSLGHVWVWLVSQMNETRLWTQKNAKHRAVTGHYSDTFPANISCNVYKVYRKDITPPGTQLIHYSAAFTTTLSSVVGSPQLSDWLHRWWVSTRCMWLISSLSYEYWVYSLLIP